MRPSARRLFSRAAVVALLGASLTATPAASAVAATTAPAKLTRPGPSFGAMFHGVWNSYTPAKREQVLSTLAANGVKSVRIDISWAMLQPNRGKLDPWGVGLTDSVINAAVAHGLKPLVMLWLTPGWANGGKGEHTLPTLTSDYQSIAQWTAHRYAGKIAGWEVWNEPNSRDFLDGASPVAYARLLKAAYPAFKRGDAKAPVVFGGTSYVDVPWITRALATGAKSSFDVMGVHPYMAIADLPPSTPDDGTIWTMSHVRVLHSLLVSSGRAAAPIWFTEFGWSAYPTAPGAPNWHRGVTSTQQASFLTQAVRIVRSTMPYVQRMYWYDDLVGIESGYNGGYGLVRPDGTPTLALKSVAAA